MLTYPAQLSEKLPSTMSNRQFGTIKWFNGQFGFITSDFGGELIVRRQSIADAECALREGMKVSYEAIMGPRLLVADQVQPEE
ncbi:hypothetical protein BDW62DRAFT_196199 [Aspergillus aurantiobrunneus]